MPAFKDFVEANPSVDFSAGASKFVMLDDTGENAEGTVTALKAELATEYASLVYAQAGSGAPNGVVTGSVGDRYIDTAATLGARVWYKASGTATNTGWLVAEGDTGRRSVTPTTGSASSSTLRRVGVVCFFEVNAGSNDYTFDLPVGFRPQVTNWAQAVNISAYGSPWAVAASATSNRVIIPAGATAVTREWSLTWSTTDAWPSSLPGSAA